MIDPVIRKLLTQRLQLLTDSHERKLLEIAKSSEAISRAEQSCAKYTRHLIAIDELLQRYLLNDESAVIQECKTRIERDYRNSVSTLSSTLAQRVWWTEFDEETELEVEIIQNFLNQHVEE